LKDLTFGAGADSLIFTDPSAHGLLTRWSAADLAWEAHALLDDDPTPVTAHWVDANAAGWIVA